MKTTAGPLHSAPFRLLWCSSLASAGAQWMERVATSWLALEVGGGAMGVGIVAAARMLPSLLFGLASGTVADRVDRRYLLMGVAGAGVALAVTLGLVAGTGAAALWQVALIAFFAGFIQMADSPARQALVYDTTGRATAANAIALNAVAVRLFGAVGALAGGLIIPTFGIANCYFIVAVGKLIGLALLTALPSQPATTRLVRTRPPFTHALADAFRLIRDRPTIRTLMLTAMACEVFGFSYQTALPTVARDVLRAGPEGLGALTSAAAAGATLAVIFLAWLPGSVRREPLLAAAYLVFGLSLLTLANAPGLPIAIAIMLVVGASSATFDTLQQTLMQYAVPEDQRGRAVGVWVLGIGISPVGHLEAGLLTSTIGAPATIITNGVLVVAGALVLASRVPAFRWRPARADLRTG